VLNSAIWAFGLRQARYWGLGWVAVLVLMTCLVVNCKRMARHAEANCGPPPEGLCPADVKCR